MFSSRTRGGKPFAAEQKIRELKPYYSTVCSCHVTYAFESESTLYSCLYVKELLAGLEPRTT